MKANEIIKTVAIYNTVLELLLKCKSINEQELKNSNGEAIDFIWLLCNKMEWYTNDFCEIMPPYSDDDNISTISCDNLAETAAKYTEIVINAGASECDLYLGY